MIAAICSGVVVVDSMPNDSSRSMIVASFDSPWIAADNWSMIARGVLAGASMPCQAVSSKPGITSPTVGTFGNARRRWRVDTARMRSRSFFAFARTSPELPNSSGICPAMTSVTASPPLLYGMCTMLMPARAANSAPARCDTDASPDEP